VLVKRAEIIVAIVSCLSVITGGVLAFFSFLGVILSISPRSAIAWAWWSFSLSVFAVVLAQVVVVLGVRRQSIGSALGCHLPVTVVGLIFIVAMVLRLLVFYS
jgi:hypothetical protein